MKQAIIVLDHGSRGVNGARDTERVASDLALRLPQQTVRIAHRELSEPSLEQVVRALVAEGSLRIVVLPYFLHLGVHVQKDLPEQLDALKKEYPSVELVLAEHLGYDERLVDMLFDRFVSASSPSS
jgi:sirohydrochlorin ferrochelatase